MGEKAGSLGMISIRFLLVYKSIRVNCNFYFTSWISLVDSCFSNCLNVSIV